MADGNYALKGAIKGLVAGLRGVTAGKLAVKKAKNVENVKFFVCHINEIGNVSMWFFIPILK